MASRPIEATGLPIGMFGNEQFSSHVVRLEPGESLLIYSDGLIEARSTTRVEYGIDRLLALATSGVRLAPTGIVGACVSEFRSFPRQRGVTDDLTVMAIRRLEG